MTTDKALVNSSGHPFEVIPDADYVGVGSGIQSASGKNLVLSVPGYGPFVRVNKTTGLLETSTDGTNWYPVTTGAMGTALIDFGSTPGSTSCNVVITGQAAIPSTASVKAWMNADNTGTGPLYTDGHNSAEHELVTIKLTCGSIVPGTGFTIYATTDLRLDSTFKVHWSWQ